MSNIFGSVFHAVASGVRHLEDGAEDVKNDVGKVWQGAVHDARSTLSTTQRLAGDAKNEVVNA